MTDLTVSHLVQNKDEVYRVLQECLFMAVQNVASPTWWLGILLCPAVFCVCILLLCFKFVMTWHFCGLLCICIYYSYNDLAFAWPTSLCRYRMGLAHLHSPIENVFQHSSGHIHQLLFTILRASSCFRSSHGQELLLFKKLKKFLYL